MLDYFQSYSLNMDLQETRLTVSSARRLALAAVLISAFVVETASAAALDPMEVAFRAAQLKINSTATEELSESAILNGRFGRSLKDLIARRREIETRLEAIRHRLRTRFVPSAADDHAAAEIRARLFLAEKETSEQLALVSDALDRASPTAMRLMRPDALTVTEARALLAPDEALVLISVNADDTQAFAMTRQTFEWARSPVGEAEIRADVQALRRSLTGSATIRGRAVPIEPEAEDISAFDAAAAFRLFQHSLQPVWAVIQGYRRLIVVRSGPLRAIPMSILVTGPAAPSPGLVRLANTNFLIDQASIAELPTLSSLRLMHCRDDARAPDVATGCATSESVPHRRLAALSLLGIGAPEIGPSAATRVRGGPGRPAVPGADTALLMALPPLPGARDELSAMASILPAGGHSHTLIGAQATEAQLRGDAAHWLQTASVVVFSTHALLGQEPPVRRIGEPGLVLTPPDTAVSDAANDGYLAASEIAELSLSARLVVLSACNTAGSASETVTDGVGVLSQAFFAAGAGALVISHWAVEDRSASDLIVRVLHGVARGADGPEALRSAILAMRGEGRFVEPRQWGPFSYVGVR